MDDTSYEIRADIVVGDRSGPGADSASRRLAQVERQAVGVGTRISNMLASSFAVLGGLTGIGAGIRAMVGLNAEIDEAQRGLAGLFSAQLDMPITRALGLARSEIGGLREDARKGVGELSDYLRGYQGLFGVAGSVSPLDQLRKLNRNALAAGFAIQGDRGLYNAPIDLQQALTAGVGERTTPIVMAALRAAGMTAQGFNALPIARQVEALNTAFAKFGPAVELMGRSWSAQSSTFGDNLKDLIRSVSSPIFERWTESLRRANGWLDEHRDALDALTSEWGQRALQVWDGLVSRAGTYAALVAAAAVVPGVGGASERIAAGAGAARGFGGRILDGLKDPLGLAYMGVPAASPGILSMAGGAFTTLSKVAGPIALISAAFLSIGGALDQFPESAKFATGSLATFTASLGGLGASFASLTAQGSILNTIGAGLLYTLGGVVTALSYVVDGFGLVIRTVGALLQVIGDGITLIGLLATGDLAGMRDVPSISDRFQEAWAPLSTSTGIQGEQGGTVPPVNPKGDIVTNINGPVTLQLKTEINADPARVIAAWDEGAEALTRFRTQARRIPALGL